MSCQCLLHSKANWLYIYIYPVFLGFPSHFGHHRALMSSLSEHLFLAQLHESFIAFCFSQLELDSSPSGELCWKTVADSHPWLVESGSWRCSSPLVHLCGLQACVCCPQSWEQSAADAGRKGHYGCWCPHHLEWLQLSGSELTPLAEESFH